MSAQERTLADELLHQVRCHFYREREKEFFEDRQILLKVVTEPAAYLHARTLELPEKRLREIVLKVLGTIRVHGQGASKMRRVSAYLLHCMQEHLKHHGEEYLVEAKRFLNVVADAVSAMKRRPQVQRPRDDATRLLAAVNATVRSKGGRKRVASREPAHMQPSLF